MKNFMVLYFAFDFLLYVSSNESFEVKHVFVMEPGFLDKGYDEWVQTFDQAWNKHIHGDTQSYLLVEDKQDIYQDSAFTTFKHDDLAGANSMYLQQMDTPVHVMEMTRTKKTKGYNEIRYKGLRFVTVGLNPSKNTVEDALIHFQKQSIESTSGVKLSKPIDITIYKQPPKLDEPFAKSIREALVRSGFLDKNNRDAHIPVGTWNEMAKTERIRSSPNIHSHNAPNQQPPGPVPLDDDDEDEDWDWPVLTLPGEKMASQHWKNGPRYPSRRGNLNRKNPNRNGNNRNPNLNKGPKKG